jgi:hypothetical protein
LSTEIADLINQLSAEYDQRCMEKHALGEEKYGAGTWLKVDTIEHALDEIVDMGNYVRMSYIKLRMLQMRVAEVIQEGTGVTAQAKEDFISGGGMPE